MKAQNKNVVNNKALEAEDVKTVPDLSDTDETPEAAVMPADPGSRQDGSRDTLRRNGRIYQAFVYFGKLLRMFVFHNDWKMLPMAAIIAGVVAAVVGPSLFKTMEGTVTGTFALSCVCIWNGFFNSIQSVCRERDIIKREHRSGLHISSYILAHMVYQALLCIAQTAIIISLCRLVGAKLPSRACITLWPVVDFGITIFLTTYAADMMALMVSCLVRSTTTAMTLMPFLLIFQLVFSGSYFDLQGPALKVTDLTISKWSLTAMCCQGEYNELPMVSLWNSLVKLKDVEYAGRKPLQTILSDMEEKGSKEEFLKITGGYNKKSEYEFTMENIMGCWEKLLIYIFIFALAGMVSLEYVDRDKR